MGGLAGGTMTRRTALWIATLGSLVLVLLHLDFWRPQRARLYFGWLPEELAWRVAWLLLAWALMLFVCARVWREESD
jgi:hypothetical protein